MGLQYIDGIDMVRMIQTGVVLLEKNKARVDALNVFPVPDGDTGTNMYLTLLSAAHEAEKRLDQNIGKVSKGIAMGSLMGARRSVLFCLRCSEVWPKSWSTRNGLMPGDWRRLFRRVGCGV